MEQKTEDPKWASFRNVILEEWPNIEEERVNSFQEDFEGLVFFVSETAQCTKVKARRDLEELRHIADGDVSSKDTLEAMLMTKITQLEERLQPYLDVNTSDISHKVDQWKEKGTMWAHDAREVIDETQKNIKENIDTHLETTLPEVEKHIKKNLWSNLAIVFGAGVILGLLGGSRGR